MKTNQKILILIIIIAILTSIITIPTISKAFPIEEVLKDYEDGINEIQNNQTAIQVMSTIMALANVIIRIVRTITIMASILILMRLGYLYVKLSVKGNETIWSDKAEDFYYTENGERKEQYKSTSTKETLDSSLKIYLLGTLIVLGSTYIIDFLTQIISSILYK